MSMLEMQQSLAKKAEDEAKRRTQNIIQAQATQVKKAVRETGKKAGDTARQGIGKIAGNKKNKKSVTI